MGRLTREINGSRLDRYRRVFPFGTLDIPGTIPGLLQWYRGDMTGVSDGNQVTTWSDASGNGSHALGQGTTKPVLRATGGPNSMPCVEFDGVDQYFQTPIINRAFAAHAFAVVIIDADPPAVGSKCGPPFGRYGTDANASAYPFTDSNVYEQFGTTVRKSTGNPSPALTSWRLYEIRTAPSDWSNWIDGTVHFSTGTNTVAFNGTGNFLGHDFTGGTNNYIDGKIADAFIYGRVLNAGEITKVKTYISGRYALTIA